MTDITKKEAKKEEIPSPENVYHKRAGADADLASQDGILYRWNGIYWAAQDVTEEESRAFAWLQTHYPSKVSTPLAKHCAAAAVMGAQRLPCPKSKSQDAVLLPLRDQYLRITKSGALMLTDPDKSAGLTYMVDAAFDPTAAAPLFHNFLEQVFMGDQDTMRWVQEYVGYSLLDDCRYQTALFLVGSGANGKTTLAEIISRLHRRTVSMQLNNLRGFSLSPLIGASLVLVDETPPRIDEQALKSLISGGLCQIDRKFRDPVSFRPGAKWLVLGNVVPSISDQSHGFWRRMPVVPFKRQFSTDEQDPSLTNKITSTEMSGVLNWAVAGLVCLMQRGRSPAPSEAMVLAQSECQKESNSVMSWWLDDRVEFNRDFETPRHVVYSDYKTWCGDNGMAALGVEKFWGRLKQIAGGEAVEPKPRKIQGKTVRVVPLRLLTESAGSTKKVVMGRW